MVVLLPHTPDMEALILAERTRRKIEEHPFLGIGPAGSGVSLRCTVSIGVAGMTPECTKASQLLQLADTAMYRAKQDGRNRSVVFRCGKETPCDGRGGGMIVRAFPVKVW